MAHETTSLRKVTRAIGTVVQLLFGLAISPVFVIALLLTLLLAWLPIAQLRALLLSVQSVLSETIGDSLAIVESPFRAALIRTRIQDGIRHVCGPCERTIIIGHSQGAAVVLDALGGIAEPFEQQQPGIASESLPPVDTLVTFGAGTNKLVSLKVLASDLFEKDAAANATHLAVGALFGAAATTTWVGYQIYTNKVPVSAVGHLLGYFVAAILASAATVWLFKPLARKIGAVLGPKDTSKAQWVYGVIIAVSAMTPFGAYLYLGKEKPIFGSFNGFIAALFMLAASIYVLMSKSLKDTITAPVKKPDGLKRWIDISASADVVSNGKTRVGQGSHEYHEISNEGSVISDHTSYWNNADEFVLRIARACAETAQSPWTSKLFAPPAVSADRARWRVGLLTLGRVSTLATWTAVMVLLCLSGESILSVEMPSWIGSSLSSVAPWLLTVPAALAATWVHLAMQKYLWRLWVNSEQREILARRCPDSTPFFVAILVFMIPLVVPIFLMQFYPERPDVFSLRMWQELGAACVIAFGCAAFPAIIWTFFRKAPSWPNPENSRY